MPSRWPRRRRSSKPSASIDWDKDSTRYGHYNIGRPSGCVSRETVESEGGLTAQVSQAPTRPSRTKRPASPPPEVTLTTGEPERRTIAPPTRPRERKGFVSAYSGWKPHAVSP